MTDPVTLIFHSHAYATCPYCNEEQELDSEYVSAKARNEGVGNAECCFCDKVFQISLEH